MSLVKLLGILDLFTGVALLFAAIFPRIILFYCAGYLILKGFVFAVGGDIISWLDVFCGAYALIASWGVTSGVISVIAALYLLQKSLFSLI